MIRIIDFILALFGLLLLSPILLIFVLLGLFDTGAPIFMQKRVGMNKKPFTLIKFRTMKTSTASVASHLSSSNNITKFGSFLRKSKIDELPQLINVLKGEMSLVGPRPNLFNQSELIEERTKLGIYKFRPGITGLSQIKNIDMSTPQLLSETDSKMLKSMSIKIYFYYLLKTVSGSGKGDAIKRN